MNIELINLYKSVVEHFGSQTLTAQALDLEQPSVWAWINGKAKMSSETALLESSNTKTYSHQERKVIKQPRSKYEQSIP